MCAPEIGKNILFRTAAQHPQQQRGHVFKNNCLTDNEQDRDAAVSISVMSFQLMKPSTKKMKNQKEIADHENGINGELDQKCAQHLGGFLFHLFQTLRIVTV